MFRTCVFEQKTTQKLDIQVPLTNFATVGAVAWKWSPWVIPQKNFILVGRACSWPEQGKPKTVTPIVPPLVPKPYAICKALHDVHRSMPFMFGHVFKIDFPPCLKTPQSYLNRVLRFETFPTSSRTFRTCQESLKAFSALRVQEEPEISRIVSRARNHQVHIVNWNTGISEAKRP